MLVKNTLFLGSLFLGLAVLIGAFGAHGLEKIATEKALKTFETGVRYHFYHGFALLILGLLKHQFKDLNIRAAKFLFTLGILLFSFNCYLYVLTEVKFFAMLVPIGGVSFVVAWFILAFNLKGLKE